MIIRYLTPKEEKELLESCKENYIDCGSSRAVFETFWYGERVAVKVFLDQGGYIQTQAEIRLFEELGRDNCVAEIKAIGKTCIVTEWIGVCDSIVIEDIVESFDYDDFVERSGLDVGCGFDDALNHYSQEEIYDMIVDVFETLTSWCGKTGDNQQIGWSYNRKTFVAFDYGYNTDTDFKEQVGNMQYYQDVDIIDAAQGIVDKLNYVFQKDYTYEEYDNEEKMPDLLPPDPIVLRDPVHFCEKCCCDCNGSELRYNASKGKWLCPDCARYNDLEEFKW